MSKKKKPKPKRRRKLLVGDAHDFIKVMVIEDDGTQTPKLMTREEFAEIQVPTAMLQSELTPEQSALARFTYKHAGRLVVKNYEKWELGFLQERKPDDELVFWMRVSAFLDHKQIKSDAVAKAIIRDWCTSNLSDSLQAEIKKFCKSLDHAALIKKAFDEYTGEG